MAYATTNPPRLVSQGITGMKIWLYDDDDPAATVRVTDYVSNASDLGMEVGDLVIHEDLSAGLTNTYRVDSVTSGGAGDLADATVIGSTTDSD